MKRIYSTLLAGMAMIAGVSFSASAQMPGQALPAGSKIYNLYDWTVFYDGYKTDEVVDADAEDGILRFTNYHYSAKVDAAQVIELGDELQLEVLIGAMCDNYDRLGRAMLAFPPKGSADYDPATVEKIEIARFITPFMNWNRSPYEVPYVYDLNDVKQLLTQIVADGEKDVWLEIELFGIPYAAQQQVAGCSTSNSVFNATVSFGGHSSENTVPEISYKVVMTPINVSKCEIFGNINLNNYNEVATDTVGTTTKTYRYIVPQNVADAQITLINSNHGAGENGEEYVRRKHLIYLDGELVHVYTPGGVSCEPYRKYNTQPNGIYGYEPDDDWSWNNWCPGQAVPTRRIAMGPVAAGEHTLMIRVPDAEFYGKDGDYRPSAWFMGVVSGKVADPSGIEEITKAGISLTYAADMVRIKGDKAAKELTVYSYDGRLLEGRYNPGEEFSMVSYPGGQYIVVVETADGEIAFIKVVR